VDGSIVIYLLEDCAVCQDNVIVIETLQRKAMRFCGYPFVKWGIEMMDEIYDHNELV
jgi:hypothetical protein